MSGSDSYINHDLNAAHVEQQEFAARMRSLAATACDTALDDETRLRALMTINAAIWSRRTGRYSGEIPDLKRKLEDQRRAIRSKAERVAHGSTRVRKVRGAMHVTDAPDAAAVAVTHKHVCVICGSGFTPTYKSFQRGRAALYCGNGCRQEAYRRRQAA